MTALSRTARAVAVTGAAAAAITLGMAACGASVVPKDQVASTISAELQKQGITTENLSCPGDLRAEVGESIRCEITAGEQPVDVVARVTSVEGSTVNYDITTEARPIAKALLEKQIGEHG